MGLVRDVVEHRVDLVKQNPSEPRVTYPFGLLTNLLAGANRAHFCWVLADLTFFLRRAHERRDRGSGVACVSASTVFIRSNERVLGYCLSRRRRREKINTLKRPKGGGSGPEENSSRQKEERRRRSEVVVLLLFQYFHGPKTLRLVYHIQECRPVQLATVGTFVRWPYRPIRVPCLGRRSECPCAHVSRFGVSAQSFVLWWSLCTTTTATTTTTIIIIIILHLLNSNVSTGTGRTTRRRVCVCVSTQPVSLEQTLGSRTFLLGDPRTVV